jgi:hypothetical protein
VEQGSLARKLLDFAGTPVGAKLALLLVISNDLPRSPDVVGGIDPMLRKGLLPIFLLVALTATCQQPNPGQSGKSDASSASPDEYRQRDFGSLLVERDKTTTEIEVLNTNIYWLNDAISKRRELNETKLLKKPIDELEKGIAESLKTAGVPGIAYEDFEKQLSLMNDSVSDKVKRKGLIDKELLRRADIVGPQQTFKLQMSSIFAGLVGVVIAGFFTVAFRDKQVRREIFSGQAGIQFVTLFSLVIAIILFGIIDILEGKELAALLGGLSGYILGRSTSTPGQRAQTLSDAADAAKPPDAAKQGDAARQAKPAEQGDAAGHAEAAKQGGMNEQSERNVQNDSNRQS